MQLPWLCGFLVLSGAAASLHAQEGAVRQVNLNTMNWGTFGTQISGLTTSNTLVMQQLEAMQVCAAAGMFYAPANNPRADGCK